MELTKEQQLNLDAWIATVLTHAKRTSDLIRIMAQLNEQRLTYVLTPDATAQALLDAKYKAVEKRFIEITPDYLNYYIEPASAKTLINQMLDSNTPRKDIQERLDGINPLVAMLLRRQLKKTFNENHNESARFRMEFFNQLLKRISNDHQTALQHASPYQQEYAPLTSTIRQLTCDTSCNEVNERLLNKLRNPRFTMSSNMPTPVWLDSALEPASDTIDFNDGGFVDMLVDRDELEKLTSHRNDLLDEAASLEIVRSQELGSLWSKKIKYADEGIKRIEAKRAGQTH